MLHRWGSIIALLPITIIIFSGIVLQLKKVSPYVQPPTQSGAGTEPAIGFDRILEVVKTVPEAEIESWEDVDRLDVRPSKGVVKVRCKNRYEVQIDTETAQILHVAFRRSDLIESIHDGSYFNEHFKLWVFLPAGIVLAALLITGVHLFLLPHLARRKRVSRGRV
ncbi:PepSY domain-containing protein [Akkermansiaceae bacterium]|nr:PepSY domain-containing protein [Akkermansiaceae bacterium]MDC0305087.1 PepSY domain-containing protein [bacterium]MDA7538790.1 PepSY domain-containing protein [Akkermansiaceae bacterium]MDA7652587.1 PepSY domain-containing protein [Akkermansiaceae bacterium]MDA7884152.1 PepSY domain-containing protein [Akkermansiaceae bacterium]